jgi:NDP-sugar pyrophosphorylase family protein
VAADRPKALVEVAGQPFLFHQLRLLADNGARRVVLCVGYLGEQVRATLGEQHFGLELLYSFDAPGLDGTLGAIRRASRLLGERFLVQYGDTYLQVDYGAFASGWQRSGRCAAMAVLHNAGRWGASNVSFHDGRIERYDKNHPTADMEWIDYGLGGFTSAALAMVPQPERDLSVLQSELAGRRELYGFAATKRFYEIGTPTALRETDRYLRSRAIG